MRSNVGDKENILFIECLFEQVSKNHEIYIGYTITYVFRKKAVLSPYMINANYTTLIQVKMKFYKL